jgi:hypothetical protein
MGRWAMRWGFGRDDYRIAPGVHAFGEPNEDSPVLVSCNYKLTFDHLRKVWAGLDVWVLVLETFGINVWCAAGKGTFGTDELVARIEACGVADLVRHRELILPQLGAPGVAGHEVTRQTGFKVTYGPVRAEDVPSYLADGKQATDAMRQVTFTTRERFILTPVELTVMLAYVGWVALFSIVVSGFGPSIWSPSAALWRGVLFFFACVAGLLGGAVMTPVLLPWLPGRFFAVRGAVVGLAISGLVLLAGIGSLVGTLAAAGLLGMVVVTSSFVGMNFTGATTFTSPSGVEKEMRRVLPWQIVAAVLSLVLWIAGAWG